MFLLTATITNCWKKPVSRKRHKFRFPGKGIGNRPRRSRRGKEGMEEKRNNNISKATREDANAALGNDPITTGEVHSPRTGNTEAPSFFSDDATDNSKVEKAEAAKSGGSKESDAADSIVVRETGQIEELSSAQTMGNSVSPLNRVKIQVIPNF